MDRGLTLIEVLLVLALSAVLAIAAALSVGGLSKGALVADGRRLRRIIHSLHLAARHGESSYLLELNEKGYEPRGAALPPFHFFPQSVGADTEIEVNSSKPWLIRFYPSGVVSPTSVTLTAHGEVCLLTVSLRGRVRLRC